MLSLVPCWNWCSEQGIAGEGPGQGRGCELSPVPRAGCRGDSPVLGLGGLRVLFLHPRCSHFTFIHPQFRAASETSMLLCSFPFEAGTVLLWKLRRCYSNAEPSMDGDFEFLPQWHHGLGCVCPEFWAAFLQLVVSFVSRLGCLCRKPLIMTAKKGFPL